MPPRRLTRCRTITLQAMEPYTESTCRLCRVATAKVVFTSDWGVIDVDCTSCGRFRIEIPGYNITLDALSGAQRLKMVGLVQARHKDGDQSPLVTREFLTELVAS
jgi:hypothetical protein